MGQLTLAAGGSAAAATQAKYEALTSVGMLARVSSDSLLAVVDGAGLARICGFVSGSKFSLRLEVSRAGTDVSFWTRDDNNGTSTTVTVPLASLTAGAYTTVSAFLTGAGAVRGEILVRQNGVTLGSQNVATALTAPPTGTGNGAFAIGGGIAGVIDAVYVFDRRITVVDHDTEPTTGSTGLIGGYPIAETSGSTTADMVSGGTALALTSATLGAGGTWDGAPPPTPVADTLRFVSIPDPIIAGTPYTLQVEAWDSTLGVRVTSFTSDITIGIDVAVPVGYVIESGVLTRTAVAGLATFPSIIFSIGGGGEPAPLPSGDVGAPPNRPIDLDRNARRMEMRGQLNKVLSILSRNAPKRPR